ncbi:hypothetical protein GCK72_021370 [Caenorhabditis remanei]|uniref:F-box domain-containing protein n=1 Tax=Caenorhabditis remanei TaxID=31234 RepID=A0A6A5GJL8_CAERE|nr:hypothetical protein GCK72_021370 [Caenorhabditis remanei]KAF1754806.1 hypothetical protein GCK72_021370 [Caenorhabditis remanei]
MAPSFLEIPDLPMEMIMNNLDFFAIQSVRKTCWDLRNFIDDKKPGIYMEQINLRAISDDGYEHKTVENLNFLDAVLHDFKVVLNSQKSIFEKVTVTSKTFFEKFEETMKSQKPIATERMDIYGESLEQGRQIMQHADPKYLKKISISMSSPNNGEYVEYPINIFEAVKFESSKNIHNFSHFATTSIQLDNLDVETFRAIKEVCLFVQMSIYINLFRTFFDCMRVR